MVPYTRKGEWLEIRLSLDAEDIHNVSARAASLLRLSDKELALLLKQDGVQISGGRLLVRLFADDPGSYSSEWSDLNILYEDDFCLVVSKPAGMPVHPTESGGSGSLANAVAAYYEATGQRVAVRHIHRLDADTTGPVLYAKNAYAQTRLDEAMRLKQIHRAYLALVKGSVQSEKGTITAAIGRDRHHSIRRRVSPGGDQAVTYYNVLERFSEATLLGVQLETGRTHQIRVHMSHIGHPLLGDSLYGGPTQWFNRQALHGESLTFAHPYTQEMIEIRCPIPADIQSLLDFLK
ncbi:MAG: pseudouridine synthase [Paenibacillus sp.]|nr:pseudouridine synthase [Paenibacillus sp.]